MGKRTIYLYLICLVPLVLIAQTSSQEDKTTFLKNAQASYYKPVQEGLTSFTCEVKTDWDTVPKALLMPAEAAGRQPLESTRLWLTMDDRGKPSMRHEYSSDPVVMKPMYEKLFGWLSDVVSGTMSTWGVKALNGPFPWEQNVASIEEVPAGHRVTLKNPKVVLLLDKNYRMTEAITDSPEQKIDEHLSFADSPEGFLFKSADAVNREGNNETRVQYEVDYQRVDKFMLPHNLHIKVNDSIDMKFVFDKCSVEKGIVIHLPPSPTK